MLRLKEACPTSKSQASRLTLSAEPFINKLLDLHEDGWSNKGSASYGNPHGPFFDPAGL
jgi:hypothetical protein